MKHTPGPWKVAEGSAIVAEWEGNQVQIASLSRTHWSQPSYGKNARFGAYRKGDGKLIASAPDYREALEKIRDQEHALSPCECDDHTSPECCANAQDFYCAACIAGAALAKVEQP
jgi:hypothetical protein